MISKTVSKVLPSSPVHRLALFLILLGNAIFSLYVMRNCYGSDYSQQVLRDGANKNAFPSPPLSLPARKLEDEEDVLTRKVSANIQNVRRNSNVRQPCQMETCFDFSRCPLDSGFPVYFYPVSDPLASRHVPLSSLLGHFGIKRYITDDPKAACIFVVVLGERRRDSVSEDRVEEFLHSLPHWQKNGDNHILISLARDSEARDYFTNVDTGRAVIVQSGFERSSFRRNYDLIVPPVREKTDEKERTQPPPPLYRETHRNYLLSFAGQHTSFHSEQSRISEASNSIVKALEETQSRAKSLGENVKLDMFCETSTPKGLGAEWGLCETTKQTEPILLYSTFAIIISPLDDSLSSTVNFQLRLSKALKNGAIPVVLGTMYERLPYGEILHWDDAVLTLPLPRIKDLLFFLRSFGDKDIARMRLQGRFLWETYFCSPQRIVETALAVLRFRLQIPPLPIKNEPSVSVFGESSPIFKDEKRKNETDAKTQTKEIQPKPRIASEKFRRNFSRSFQRTLFNTPGDPFSLVPSSPYEPVLPSEAKFWKTWGGANPANQMTSASSRNFSKVLQGNLPEEQFTAMVMTYKRESSLMACLERLRGLPYLNKVIVIWNDPDPPSPALRWSDPGVPLEVLKQRKNSLNNHFLPFESIETDCILTLDDDIVVPHERLLLGFRIWRQDRDRLVGYYARHHWWNEKENRWKYSWDLPNELSIMIPSGSFFHKYYLYMFTYVMPQAVRDHIDKKMNGEDIAMNFMISHITRKPPIMVRSPWKPYCPNCKQALSHHGDHLAERHECVSVFAKAFGYMPLLFTDYIADKLID